MQSANLLSNRQAAVLEIAVRMYIADGEPVSSAEVSRALEPMVSSATVRNDMVALTDNGYLMQPHTSSGRIPTAAAFRLVTERLLERERGDIRATHARNVADASETAQKLAKRNQAAAFCSMDERVGYAGFEFVLMAPEITTEEDALESFAHLMEALPIWSQQIRQAIKGRIGVFVAEDNPIAPTQHFSIVAARLPNDGIAAVLGPLRMRYEVAIQSLMKLV